MDTNAIVHEFAVQMSGISMLNDLIIKKIWGTPNDSEERLLDFLNAFRKQIHEPPIEFVEICDPTNHPDSQEEKTTYLDIKARDSEKNWYNIEVQFCEHPFFISRIIYYGASVHSSQLKWGADYSNIHPTICIAIINFNLFPDPTKALHSFGLLSLEEPHVQLSKDLQFYFVEMPKINPEFIATLNSDLVSWIKFLNFPTTSEAEMNTVISYNPLIAQTMTTVSSFISNNRDVLEEREKARRTHVAEMEGAHSRGLQQGLQQGFQQGHINGLLGIIQKHVSRRFKTILSDEYLIKLRELDTEIVDEIILQMYDFISIEQLEHLIDRIVQEDSDHF